MAKQQPAKQNTNPKPAAETAPEFPSAFSLFGPSWEAVKINFATLLLLIVSVMAASAVAIIVGLLFVGAFKDTPAALYPLLAVLGVAFFIFLMVIAPAMVFTQLKAAQDTKVDTDVAFQQGKKYLWRFWGLSILIGLIVLGGFILLIIPGFFMVKRYLLAPYFMVDKDLAIGEAMRASVEAGKKYSGAIWGVMGVEILISLASSIPFVGSLVGLVLNIGYYCAPAVRYEQVKAAG